MYRNGNFTLKDDWQVEGIIIQAEPVNHSTIKYFAVGDGRIVLAVDPKFVN